MAGAGVHVHGHVPTHAPELLAENEIAEILPGTSLPPGALDMQGDYLAPGMVELHTDNLERHMRPRPGVDWPHASAILAHDAELAGCGITTVFDAMRVGSIPSDGPDDDYKKYARPLAHELAALRARGVLRISAARQQQVDRGGVATAGGAQQTCAALGIDRIGGEAQFEQAPHRIGIAGHRRGDQVGRTQRAPGQLPATPIEPVGQVTAAAGQGHT